MHQFLQTIKFPKITQKTLNAITQEPPNLFFSFFISNIPYEILSIKTYIVNIKNREWYIKFNIKPPSINNL